MTVGDIQTSHVKYCHADTNLATAAQLMWDCDCGVVPVVDDDKRVLGMITDRDICIAAATRDVRPSEIRVGDVMSRDVRSCTREDDVVRALETMKRHRIRRLPVVDRSARLVGILSLNDVALRAGCREGAAVPGQAFIDTLQTICAHAGAPSVA